MRKDLTISIVNYNSEKDILKCIKSIYDNKGNINLDVVIVDNNSNDKSVELIKKFYPEVTLICNKKNVGFASGNNQVLREFDSRYYLIANPDIIIQKGALKKMVHFLDSTPDAGAVGCKILNMDNTVQPSCRRYPSFITLLSRGLAIDILWPKNNITRDYLMHDFNHNDTIPVNWLTGCCIMLRKETIQDVGFMDERYFLYFEDTDLCYRINKKWKVYYLPDAFIYHEFQHKSRNFGNIIHKFHHIKSAYVFFSTHGLKLDHKNAPGHDKEFPVKRRAWFKFGAVLLIISGLFFLKSIGLVSKNANAIDQKNPHISISPVIDVFSDKLTGWSTNCSSNIKLEYNIDKSVKKNGKNSLKMIYKLSNDETFWGYVDKDLGSTRNWLNYDSISFWTYVPQAAKDIVSLSVMVYEEDGSAYIKQHVRGLKSSGWEKITAPLSEFHIAGSWTKDENSKLDFDQIKKVSIGIFQPTKYSDKEFVLYINDIHAVKSKSLESDTMIEKKFKAIRRKNQLQKGEPPDGKVYHGVFAFSAPMKGWGKDRSDWEKQLDEKAIKDYENVSGSTVALVSFFWFLDWEFPQKICDNIQNMGKNVHLGVIIGGITLSDIIDGKVDKQLNTWAVKAKALKKPLFFRFLPEMNGNWHIYSEANDPKQTHEKYIKAWRHVVNTFRKAKATNVIFVWAPTSMDVGNIHWTDYYPGDEYVDWVGVSVYSFIGAGDPYHQIFNIYKDYADRKPIMIAECSAGDADDNPGKYSKGASYYDNPEKWIDRFFDTLEKNAPRVKAFVWFNIDRERIWKIQESKTKADKFRKRLKSDRYHIKIK